MIFGSHKDPDGTPVAFRRMVIMTTTISNADESRGITTSQLESLVTRPAKVSFLRDCRRPCRDRRPARKHAVKTMMQNHDKTSRLTENGILVKLA